MPRFRDLSIRLKIPIRSLVLIWITATVVSGALIFQAYQDAKRDIRENAESLAGVLADSLVSELGHDDVWRAYGLISAALRAPGADTGNRPSFIVVLDANYRVFVSSDAERYPLLTDLPASSPDFADVVAALRASDDKLAHLVEPPGAEHFYLAQPIIADGQAMGSLVLGYSRHVFQPRFERIVLQAGLITLLIVVVMLPFTWYWGSHLADPLVALVQHMRSAPALPDPDAIRSGDSNDEIGQLASAFRRMVGELREKQALEQQVIASDRLAAIGRLSAGIAHEINNPLGGILNAVNTLKHHAELDPRAAKSLALVERGLHQIRDTVAALLVEARVSRQPLSADDIDDVRTLALAQARRQSAQLDWHNAVTGTIDLPATQVRQVVLNLLLNALEAAHDGGRVWANIGPDDGDLVIDIANEGEAIAESHLPYLFEPFASAREGGHGLGLWVTYQLARQLQGSIDATSEAGVTRFVVRLPIQPAGLAEAAPHASDLPA